MERLHEEMSTGSPSTHPLSPWHLNHYSELYRPLIKECKAGVESDIQTIGYRCRTIHSASEGHLHPAYLPQILVNEKHPVSKSKPSSGLAEMKEYSVWKLADSLRYCFLGFRPQFCPVTHWLAYEDTQIPYVSEYSIQMILTLSLLKHT